MEKIFELRKRDESLSDEPEWLFNTSEKVKVLYQAIKERVVEIENTLKSSNKSTQITRSHYKINKSALSKNLGYSETYINKHAELNQLVDSEQRRLDRLAKAVKGAQSEKDYAKNRVTQMRRDDLINEVMMLRKALSQHINETYIRQLNFLLESGLTESQKVTTRRLRLLENEISDISKKNTKLEAINRRLTEELSVQMNKNSLLENQVKALSLPNAP